MCGSSPRRPPPGIRRLRPTARPASTNRSTGPGFQRFRCSSCTPAQEVQEAAPLVRVCYLTKRFEVGGEWLPTEMFLRKRFGVEVTHGLCPEAVARSEADLLKGAG